MEGQRPAPFGPTSIARCCSTHPSGVFGRVAWSGVAFAGRVFTGTDGRRARAAVGRLYRDGCRLPGGDGRTGGVPRRTPSRGAAAPGRVGVFRAGPDE